MAKGKIVLGAPTSNAIESAMAKAIENARIEANAVWEKRGLSADKKREIVAAIMAPDEIRRRMLAARDEVTGAASRSVPPLS